MGKSLGHKNTFQSLSVRTLSESGGAGREGRVRAFPGTKLRRGVKAGGERHARMSKTGDI